MSDELTEHASQLKKKIEAKDAVVGILGLGYVGLPLIDAFISKGFSAIGYDVDKTKIEKLNAGQSYIEHIPESSIQGWLKQDKFEATDDFDRLDEADIVLICVPTPLSDSRDPDLTYVEKSAEAIANRLRPGQLVVLESTTYPGTTRDVLLPILNKKGLTCGKDFSSPIARSGKILVILNTRHGQFRRSLEAWIQPVWKLPMRFIRKRLRRLFQYQAAKSQKLVKFWKTRTEV